MDLAFEFASIKALKDRTGLTSVQLGRLFGVPASVIELWLRGGRIDHFQQQLLDHLLRIADAAVEAGESGEGLYRRLRKAVGRAPVG